MVLKSLFIAVTGATFALWSGPSFAGEYRADDFLRLDLPMAVLSPEPLGPASKFVHVPVEAKADRAGESVHAQAAHPAPSVRVAHARAEKPRAAARTGLAHRHGNPLDAQARDTRIQVWPCKSGGICRWQRYRDRVARFPSRRCAQQGDETILESSARHIQIAAKHQQHRQHQKRAHHRDDDREQLVGVQPSL